jgi:hypothetical protein
MLVSNFLILILVRFCIKSGVKCTQSWNVRCWGFRLSVIASLNLCGFTQLGGFVLINLGEIGLEIL